VLYAHDLLILDEGRRAGGRRCRANQQTRTQMCKRLLTYNADVGVVGSMIMATEADEIDITGIGASLWMKRHRTFSSSACLASPVPAVIRFRPVLMPRPYRHSDRRWRSVSPSKMTRSPEVLKVSRNPVCRTASINRSTRSRFSTYELIGRTLHGRSQTNLSIS
jgi:hypothetical protein